MSLASEHYDLDLGNGHWLTFTWYGTAKDGSGGEKIGGIITHEMPNGKMCEGSLWFDVQHVRDHWPNKPRWIVSSWEPLTCAPSFLCHCGDHGFIRDGKWVVA